MSSAFVVCLLGAASAQTAPKIQAIGPNVVIEGQSADDSGDGGKTKPTGETKPTTAAFHSLTPRLKTGHPPLRRRAWGGFSERICFGRVLPLTPPPTADRRPHDHDHHDTTTQRPPPPPTRAANLCTLVSRPIASTGGDVQVNSPGLQTFSLVDMYRSSASMATSAAAVSTATANQVGVLFAPVAATAPSTMCLSLARRPTARPLDIPLPHPSLPPSLRSRTRKK